ncbi:ATP synthase subunit d, mitochondrial-like [Lycorma delicatula]|uniref:ATP synthase subunit d, mitochondrial-like n=1 Tax=Lycorma delicatula TaxID=130591 RepID=UPI003F5155D7
MAAKRIASSTFNWATLAERVPEHQKAQYLAFKAKSDSYVRRMTANPPAPPAIDWEYYVNTVPVPGLVEDFRKKYKDVKIPVPSTDSQLADLDKLAVELDQSISAFKTESVNSISQYQQQIEKIKASIPFEQMTYEELYQYAPDYAEDIRATIWPPYLEQQKAPEH